MTPFDFINDISYNKSNLITNDRDEAQYNSFIINKYFALFPDTLFFANEMNINNCLDNKMQHDYLFQSIRRKKRFCKWPWSKQKSEEFRLVQSVYKYNHRKAKTVLNVLTAEQLKVLKKQQEQGGQNDRSIGSSDT